MEFVYVFRQGKTNRYKIGRTKDLAKRRKQVQTGNSDEITLVCAIQCDAQSSKIEAMLKARFKELRVSGEWFLLNEITLDMLKWLIRLIAAARDGFVVTDENELFETWKPKLERTRRHKGKYTDIFGQRTDTPPKPLSLFRNNTTVIRKGYGLDSDDK